MSFNVGDRVRIMAWPVNGHKIGDFGTIDRVTEDGYDVRVAGVPGLGWYEPYELETAAMQTVSRMLPVVPYGMTADDLARYVGEFVNAARERILNIGAEQYDHGCRQAFEDMNLSALLNATREEAQDLAGYAAMLDIRIGRILAALDSKEVS